MAKAQTKLSHKEGEENARNPKKKKCGLRTEYI
jgi:hypothetical protein